MQVIVWTDDAPAQTSNLGRGASPPTPLPGLLDDNMRDTGVSQLPCCTFPENRKGTTSESTRLSRSNNSSRSVTDSLGGRCVNRSSTTPASGYVSKEPRTARWVERINKRMGPGWTEITRFTVLEMDFADHPDAESSFTRSLFC